MGSFGCPFLYMNQYDIEQYLEGRFGYRLPSCFIKVNCTKADVKMEGLIPKSVGRYYYSICLRASPVQLYDDYYRHKIGTFASYFSGETINTYEAERKEIKSFIYSVALDLVNDLKEKKLSLSYRTYKSGNNRHPNIVRLLDAIMIDVAAISISSAYKQSGEPCSIADLRLEYAESLITQ